MSRAACVTIVRACGFLVIAAGLAVASAAAWVADGDRLVPESLVPLEPLVGEWRVHGFTEADKIKGWDEPATWGWVFEKGRIVGLEVTFKGGKYFSSGRLEPAGESGVYEFTATTPRKTEAVYQGELQGKRLRLVRESGDEQSPDQFLLEMLHDVRYQMVIEARRSATSVRKVATLGATRSDVRFGAASKEEQGPKCIITGAPGTSQVAHQGQTYYVCCTGCRAEFEHDPEKWLRLARESKSGKDGGATPGASKSKGADRDGSAPGSGSEVKRSEKGATQDDAERKDDADSAGKAAASLLSRAKLLEKNGKPDAALPLYERIMKEHAKSPEAKEAAERIKALKPPRKD